MVDRVVIMSDGEYDDLLSGLDGLPFSVNRIEGSNGKFVRSVITVSKTKIEKALKAREFDLVKPTDGSDINFNATIKWKD